MGYRVITPEDVLESLMNDGTIDAIRLKVINQLKANGPGERAPAAPPVAQSVEASKKAKK